MLQGGLGGEAFNGKGDAQDTTRKAIHTIHTT